MRLSDKIGLWADNKISELYFERVPFQTLQEWALGLLVPVCEHKDHETGEKCRQRGEPCLLPNYDEDAEEIQWVCYHHMPVEGYCRGCHMFWAGCEDFDFDPHGLCSNCRHDPDVTGETDEEDDYGEFYDPYEWS